MVTTGSELPGVPFLDLARLHRSIGKDIEAAIAEVVAKGTFIGGPTVSAFEDEFAAAHKLAAAVGCSSGTDALILAMRALGIGRGDEVIVPSMTFIATAEAVYEVGATPVIADVNPRTLLLDPAGVAEVRTPRTRAVVPVHLYGNCVPPEDMKGWRASGLLVIEDAAQAHLATYRGVGVGAVGHAACFSFYPGKNLGAFGDAGAVASTDEALLRAAARLRDHGRSEKYVHSELGLNARMDGLQAAVLRVKLQYLQEWTQLRQAAAERYRKNLAAFAVEGIDIVPWTAGAVHHLLVVLVRAGHRDFLRQHLSAAAIGTGVHYPVPLSKQPALRDWRRATPVAEDAAERVLSLPMDPLITNDQVDEVCRQLAGYAARELNV